MPSGVGAYNRTIMGTDEAEQGGKEADGVTWVPGSVGTLIGDWIVELYPRTGSTEVEVD